MDNYVFTYSRLSKLLNLIQVIGQLIIIIILFAVAIYLYPNIRFLISLLFMLYFIYASYTAILHFNSVLPQYISINNGIIISKFFFGKIIQKNIHDIKLISIDDPKESHHIIILFNDKDKIGIGKELKGKESLIGLLKEINPNLNIIRNNKNQV